MCGVNICTFIHVFFDLKFVPMDSPPKWQCGDSTGILHKDALVLRRGNWNSLRIHRCNLGIWLSISFRLKQWMANLNRIAAQRVKLSYLWWRGTQPCIGSSSQLVAGFWFLWSPIGLSSKNDSLNQEAVKIFFKKPPLIRQTIQVLIDSWFFLVADLGMKFPKNPPETAPGLVCRIHGTWLFSSTAPWDEGEMAGWDHGPMDLCWWCRVTGVRPCWSPQFSGFVVKLEWIHHPNPWGIWWVSRFNMVGICCKDQVRLQGHPLVRHCH